MMLKPLKHLLAGTLRRQLMIGITLVFGLAMTLFVWDTARRQQAVLSQQQTEQASVLARAAATSAAVWVASKDYGGMQDIVDSLAHYPDLQYAIILDTKGQIWAHTDQTRRRQYLSDLPKLAEAKVYPTGGGFSDVVSPVMLSGQHIGWVRVGLGAQAINAQLAQARLSGFLYGLIGISLSCLLAFLVSGRMTQRLRSIQSVADAVQAGDMQLRTHLSGDDEAAQLSRQFNRMLDGLLQRESALQESHEALTSILATTSDGYWRVDSHGRLRDVNPSYCRLSGYTREELLQMHISELEAEEDAAETAQRMGRIVLSRFEQFESVHQRKDGTRWQVEVSTSYSEPQGGQFFVFLRDISDRKRAETALRESEAQNQALINAIPDLIFVNDRNGEYLAVYASDARLLYAPREAILHRKAQELLPEPLAQRYMRGLAAALDTREIQFLNYSLSLAGGETYFEARIVARTEDTVICIVRDVTEQRRAEDSQRIAAIAFESQEGMFVADATGLIVQVNQAFSDITGYTAQEAVGKNPRMLKSGRNKPGFYSAMWETISSTGSWQGEIWNRRKSGEVFPQWLTITAVKDESGSPTHYVACFIDITLRKTAEEQIKTLAFYDPLTHLPNRRLLMDRLEQALAIGARHQRKCALLFVDLDNFKAINDTLGHYLGDLLLEQVAKRLVTCVREGDTVARLGGDEFIVMLEELSEHELDAARQAEMVGEKILEALSQPYQIAEINYRSTASIGVTLFGGKQLETLDEPLKRADLAMYQAKAEGRNTLRFFDPKMQAVVMARAATEAGLREALERNQLRLYYQAQVVDDGRVTGVEALVRWQHPQRGIVSPGEFIELAEETGLILPLGQWVLETACSQLVQWAQRPEMAHLTVAVNVSARQFHQEDFVAQILALLHRTGANPRNLKLELTESLLVTNVATTITKMTALKTVGVAFSLDDFGTGYSSLSYLKRLPLDQLKIDQGFVRDVLLDSNDAAIAKTVIVLAESLGLSVIAEGVETEGQRDFLAQQGCHAYQGYLFSRPLPLDEFEIFMKRA